MALFKEKVIFRDYVGDLIMSTLGLAEVSVDDIKAKHILTTRQIQNLKYDTVTFSLFLLLLKITLVTDLRILGLSGEKADNFTSHFFADILMNIYTQLGSSKKDTKVLVDDIAAYFQLMVDKGITDMQDYNLVASTVLDMVIRSTVKDFDISKGENDSKYFIVSDSLVLLTRDISRTVEIYNKEHKLVKLT